MLAMTTIRTRGVVVACTAAVALNFARGIPSAVQGLGLPYWLLTYEEGFIRRALVGTIFQTVGGGVGADAAARSVLVIHVVLSFALFAGLLVWGLASAKAAETPRARALVHTSIAALFLSQFPTTIAAIAGYLDVVLVLLCAVGARLAGRGRLVTAGIVAAIGPIVHDAFIFLWIPVLLIAARRCAFAAGQGRKESTVRASSLLAPAFTAALTMMLHSHEAAKRAIAGLSIADGVKDTFFTYQFGLTPRAAFAIMSDKFVAMPEQLLLSCVAFLPPAVVIAACAAALDRDDRSWRRVGFAAVVTISPCSVLLLAWDLSRFLLWATFAAFLLLLDNAHAARANTEEKRRIFGTSGTRAAAVVMLALLSSGPHLYAYFEVIYAEYHFAPAFTRHTPAAKLSYALVNAYNRKLFVRSFSIAERCAVDIAIAKKSEPCTFVLEKGGVVETGDLWLAPGSYVAAVSTSESEGCSGAPGELGVLVPRFGGMKMEQAFESSGARTTELPFSIDAEEAAMARVRIRVRAKETCGFRIDGLRIRGAP